MVEILILVKSIVLGFSVAIPIGPIGIICIRKTLLYGKKASLATGLGASLADGFFAFVAAFSVKVIAHWFFIFRSPIEIIGGIFIIYLGLKSFKKIYSELPVISENKNSYIGNFISAFLLTLTNPITLITFTLLFANFGLGKQTGYFIPGLTVAGVCIGSMAWWIALTFGVDFLKSKFTHNTLNTITRATGFILILLGILSLLSGLIKLIHFHI